jgi:hypothetical protein
MQVLLLQVVRKDNELEFDGHLNQLRENPITEMQKAVESQQLIAAGQGCQDLAAQMHATSLLAIEVNTPAKCC